MPICISGNHIYSQRAQKSSETTWRQVHLYHKSWVKSPCKQASLKSLIFFVICFSPSAFQMLICAKFVCPLPSHQHHHWTQWEPWASQNLHSYLPLLSQCKAIQGPFERLEIIRFPAGWGWGLLFQLQVQWECQEISYGLRGRELCGLRFWNTVPPLHCCATIPGVERVDLRGGNGYC
jgi:hypothetical protein